MQLIDISHDQKTIYHLTQGESQVYFLLNRSGELTFEMSGKDAQAFIFAFFIGKDEEKYELNLIQKHTAPHTTSKALVKSTLTDRANFEYTGTIRIESQAIQSDASQESRNLLLSKEAGAITKPNLEIIANDVKCHHAATVSPINSDQLFYAKSRGLNTKQAKQVLVQGFFSEALEKIESLGIDTLPLRAKLLDTLSKIYA